MTGVGLPNTHKSCIITVVPQMVSPGRSAITLRLIGTIWKRTVLRSPVGQATLYQHDTHMIGPQPVFGNLTQDMEPRLEIGLQDMSSEVASPTVVNLTIKERRAIQSSILHPGSISCLGPPARHLMIDQGQQGVVETGSHRAHLHIGRHVAGLPVRDPTILDADEKAGILMFACQMFTRCCTYAISRIIDYQGQLFSTDQHFPSVSICGIAADVLI